MFSKLLLVASAVGGLSTPVANYQHVMQEGNVQITYKYETNEINSASDFVVGHIYHCSLPLSKFNDGVSDTLIKASAIYNLNTGYAFDNCAVDNDIDYLLLYKNSDNALTLSFYINNNYNSYYTISNSKIIDTVTFDFVYHSSTTFITYQYSYFSSSTYNEIVSVQEVYHTGLFGNLADFLRYHIYGGIPHVNEITFDIGGNTTTMLDWLVVTTSIALAILSLFLLFFFFRWVVKLISGLITLR